MRDLRSASGSIGSLFAELPAIVRTIVGIIEKSPFPMFILWGPERILIYNEGYVPILGAHHPQAMGKPFFEVWPEVRQEIEPVVDRAYAGEASMFENLPVMLSRPDPQRAWFTFSYSPVLDESGATAAVLCICTETTEAVNDRRRQSFLIDLEASIREFDDPFDIVEAAQAALGNYLDVGRVGYGTVDTSERFFTTNWNWTNGSVLNHNGTHDLAAFGEEIFQSLRKGESLVVADTLADPRCRGADVSAAFAALEVRSAVTVSLIKGGRFVAALYVHHNLPRHWSTEDVSLIHDVAERTWSAVERAYAQASLRALARRQAFLLSLSDSLRRLGDAEEIKETAARLLGEFLQVGRAGYGEIDEAQEHVTVAKDWTGPTMSSLAGERRPLEIFGPAIIAELKAGRILRLDSVAANPVSAPYAAGYASIGTKSLLVVPLLKNDRLVAVLYVHEPDSRQWSDDEVEVTSEVAERTWAAVERARAEEAVRQLNATLEDRVNATLAERKQYVDIVEATDAPIQMINREGALLAINPAAQAVYERVYGVRPEIGQRIDELPHDGVDKNEAMAALWARALKGESFDKLAWWGTGNFERRAYQMRFGPVRENGGYVTGAYLIGRDVTDLLHEQERLAIAEEQLRQAQKMEAIGQLTGGVAHDFNNLLTPIIGSLDILQRRGFGGEREQRMIAGAAQAAERAKILVQRLLAFARRQPLQPAAVDIGTLVRGMAELIRSTTGPQIHVAIDVEEPLPSANADRNQLEMALLNLAVNARDAMPDGGMLRISAGVVEAGSTHVPNLSPGSYVRLSVSDTGTGMDEQTLKRATEPFFSTKGIGKGTGLGLSMVHGLAHQLGGALTIRSRPGVGTNVELWLPVTDRDAARADEAEVASGDARGSGTVLLVDDEDLVRLSTAEMLAELGYEVIELPSAEKALERLNSGLRPDLIVTDHLMPGMSGTDLARTALEIAPGTKVLIVSGYSEVEEVAPDLPRLTKPFRKDELLAALLG